VGSYEDGRRLARARQAAGATAGTLAPVGQPGAGMLPGVGTMLGGPNPAQEAQAAEQTQMGVQSPAQAATPEGATQAAVTTATGLSQVGGEVAKATVEEAKTHPARFIATTVAPMVAGPLAGAAFGGLTKLGGWVFRAGAPIDAGLGRMAARAVGAGASAAGADYAYSDPHEVDPEAIERRVMEGFGAAAVEAAAPAAARLGRRLRGRPERVAPRIVPHGIEARALLIAQGGRPTLGQTTTGQWARWTESWLTATPAGKYIYDKLAYEPTEQAARDAWVAALPEFGRDMTEKDISAMSQSALVGARDAQDALASHYYQLGDQIAKQQGAADNKVFVDPLVKFFHNDTKLQAEVLAKNPAALSISGLLSGRPGGLVDAEAVPIIRQLVTGGQSSYAPISFEQAEALRRSLNRVAYESRGTEVGKFAVPYARLLDEAMDDAAERLGIPEMRNAYKTGRAISKDVSDTFYDDTIIAGLMDKQRPEQVAAQLYQLGDVTTAERLYRVFDPTVHPEYQPALLAAAQKWGGSSVGDLKDAIVNGYLNNVMNKAGEREAAAGTEGYQAAKWQRVLTRLTDRQSPFRALEPDARIRSNYEKLAEAGVISQTRPTQAPGRWVISSVATGGAGYQVVLGLSQGDIAKAGVGVGLLAIPGGLATIARSTPVVNYFWSRATSTAARKAGLMTRLGFQAASAYTADEMAKMIGVLRSNNIPFEYTDPSGQKTAFDPQTGVTGQYAPTAAGQAAPRRRSAGSFGSYIAGRKPQGKL
jgi:hypothetical protein